MSAIRVLIVEDKVIVAKDIAASLEDLGYEVVAAVDTGEKAIAWVKDSHPDLVLMDINLKGDIDGIDAAKVINEEVPTPIIYLTAYADKATLDRAKNTHPYAYIVKPFDEKDLQIAIDLAIHNFSSHHNDQPTAEKGDGYFLKNSLFIKKDSRYHKISLDDVLYVEASGSYIDIICEKQKFTLAINLQHFENQIENDCLMRVHRSFVINLNHVTSFDNARVFVGDIEIPVSRSYREKFHRKFSAPLT